MSSLVCSWRFVCVARAGRAATGRPVPGNAPGGAVTFFCFAKRKSPKKRRPGCRALRAAPQPRASRREKKNSPCGLRQLFFFIRRLALVCGATERGTRFGSLRIAYSPSLAVRIPACKPESLRGLAACGPKAPLRPNPLPQAGEGWDEGALDSMLAQRARHPGPRGSRRAAQGGAGKEVHMFEPCTQGEFVDFPPRPSSAAKSALGRPADRGRLFFGTFLLAKQKKGTAPPGAHPGTRPQADSPRRGDIRKVANKS